MKSLILPVLLLIACTATAQTWMPVANGTRDNVYDMQVYHGNLYAAGHADIRIWNGTTWAIKAKPLGMSVPLSLAVYNDSLFVAGDWPGGSRNVTHVYKFDGSSWLQVGGDFDDTASFTYSKATLSFNGLLYSAGRYATIDGRTMNNIAAWDGTDWRSLANGLGTGVELVSGLAAHKGMLYASGSFSSSGSDTSIKRLARWDGTAWSSVGSGKPLSTTGPMISFGGSLYIGNVFDTLDGQPALGVARWNDTSFSAAGSGQIISVATFLVYNNELYLSATIRVPNTSYREWVVMKLVGTTWIQMGATFNDVVLALEEYNGDLFGAGRFTSPERHVARFDPTPIGVSGPSATADLLVYPNPASEQIIVKSIRPGVLVLSSITGESLMELAIAPPSTDIDISSLPKGTYVLSFLSGSATPVRRVVVKQ